MELSDYLRALRRSWLPLVVATLVGVAAAFVYLQVTPKTYDAYADVVIVANAPVGIPDAETGSVLAQNMATTVAAIIDSPVILAPSAAVLGDEITASELAPMVEATVQPDNGIVTIVVQADDPTLAAEAAEVVAERAIDIVPRWIGGENADGDPALKLELLAGPETPSAPSAPAQKGVLVIGLLVGLSLGIAIAIARYSMDSRVRSRESLRAAGMPVLAALPRSEHPLVLAEEPDGDAATAYQALRTTMVIGIGSSRPSTLVVPLSRRDSGASVPANLALSLARSGRRTLVIDADGRDGTIAPLFGAAADPGLFTVIAGHSTLANAVSKTSEPHLFVLSAGDTTASPADLLARPEFVSLVTDAEAAYDSVIVSAPALLDYPDGVVVAKSVGHIIVTVEVGRDDREALDSNLDTLASVGGSLLGLTLMGTASRSLRPWRRRTPADNVHEGAEQLVDGEA